jgi:hypothetical protein
MCCVVSMLLVPEESYHLTWGVVYLLSLGMVNIASFMSWWGEHMVCPISVHP